MQTVGVWVMYQQILDRDSTVETLLRARCNHASLMINNFSKARGPTPFSTRDRAKLVDFADACREHGIAVSLTTWVMPHEVFVDGMLEQLPALLTATGAQRLYLDAEEPWIRASGVTSSDYERAAQRIAEGLAPITELALSAIVYADNTKVYPLARRCPVYSPQAYATEGGDLQPGRAVEVATQRWIEKFGAPESWSMGLAAYKLPDDPTSYMQPPIDDCRVLEINDVCYWSVFQLGQDEDRIDFVSQLRAPPQPSTSSGIMPVLDIAAMPSSTYNGFVKRVQALLSSHDVDPGPVDGKPGTKTLTAVQSFQAHHGLPKTGIVDGGLWWLLLAE